MARARTERSAGAPADPGRIRPLEAVRGLRALAENPDDTAQVFRVIRALSGRSFERVFRRVEADPSGARILAERRRLLPVLADRERLRSLPEGSLGHEYARFMDAEGISPEGLVAASEQDAPDVPNRLGEEGRVLGERLRDMHDLWHVVTGYGRDLLGEAALLAFTYAQTRNRGIGAIVAYGLYRLWRAGATEAVAMVRGGYRRGRRATFLPAQEWEALLPLPLEEVRRRLAVEPAAPYAERRSSGTTPAAA